MQLTIFDAMLASAPAGSSGKTCPESSPPETPSAPSWVDWSATMPPSRNLVGDDGPVRVWYLDPADAPHGGVWTPSTSAWPNDGTGCSSSLAAVLETGEVPTRYFLSSKACSGIMRRAEKRGRELPSALSAALRRVADGVSEPTKPPQDNPCPRSPEALAAATACPTVGSAKGNSSSMAPRPMSREGQVQVFRESRGWEWTWDPDMPMARRSSSAETARGGHVTSPRR